MSRRLAAVAVFALLAVPVLGVSTADAATASLKPTITKTNDANHDGTFSASEAIPSHSWYPYTVTYQLSIFGGTSPGPKGPFHTIVAITDDKTSNIGTCAALVGTTINSNTTKTCTYSVTLTQPGVDPLVNTATLTYDSGGNDVVSNSSTVTFPTRKHGHCNGSGGGSHHGGGWGGGGWGGGGWDDDWDGWDD